MKFTKEERTALRSILDTCIEQYETSGGDIDYAGLGEESPRALRDLIEKLKPTVTEYITAVYAREADMTFIMRETWTEDGEPVATECVGWYHGEPDEGATMDFIGKLKAEY